MTKYFSPSTGGFYDVLVHGARIVNVEVVDDDAAAELARQQEERLAAGHEIFPEPIPMKLVEIENPDCRLPIDAIEIGPERHAELIAAQAEGKEIVAGARGLPLAVDRDSKEAPQRTIEEQLAALRRRRDRELRGSDWTQLPDAMAAARRKLWAQHRQALRELPALIEAAVAKGHAPTSIPYPEAPS